MRKKLLIILVALIVIVVGKNIGNYVYRMHHPYISFGISEGSIEHLLWTTSGPMTWDMQCKLIDFHTWNDLVITELSLVAKEPRDIRVSGEVKDGKTTIRYAGTYTTKDGETVEYLEEKTFDYELPLGEDVLKD